MSRIARLTDHVADTDALVRTARIRDLTAPSDTPSHRVPSSRIGIVEGDGAALHASAIGLSQENGDAPAPPARDRGHVRSVRQISRRDIPARDGRRPGHEGDRPEKGRGKGSVVAVQGQEGDDEGEPPEQDGGRPSPCGNRPGHRTMGATPCIAEDRLPAPPASQEKTRHPPLLRMRLPRMRLPRMRLMRMAPLGPGTVGPAFRKACDREAVHPASPGAGPVPSLKREDRANMHVAHNR